MKIVSTHSHLLRNPQDLDYVVESGMLSQVWLLGLPRPYTIAADSRAPYSATPEELLETARRYPGFFLPFQWVDFRLGPEQIDRAVDQGFVGFKGFCPKLPYDDDSYMPIYERISKYKTCMVFHTGHVSTPSYAHRSEALGYSALNMSPSTLYKVAKFFPDIQIVAAHFGVPWEREFLTTAMASCPNLYIDISGGEYAYIMEYMEKAASYPCTLSDGSNGILANKLLYGVDSFMGCAQYHRDIAEWIPWTVELAMKVKEKNLPWAPFIEDIFYGNSQKLLKINQLYHSK